MDRALTIDHIGSTSVPGLPVRPIIDVDLTVVDSAAEIEWVPELETAGFTLKVREIKRHVAAGGHTDAMLCNNANAWFMYDLYEVILAADPAHQHDPQPA